MAQRLPWLRLFAEGIAIVVSILLAFAIQAWWEELGERRAEAELIVNLSEAVETSRGQINARFDSRAADSAAVSVFFQADPSQLAAVPRDSASRLYAAMYRANTYEALAGPLAAAVNTGTSLLRSSLRKPVEVTNSLTQSSVARCRGNTFRPWTRAFRSRWATVWVPATR